MLVLSRKEGERLSIGNDITIVVSKVSGNRVTIGIEAPKHVKIVRSELTIDLDDSDVAPSSEDPSAAKRSLKVFSQNAVEKLRHVG